jgi:hypothetical protein
VQPANPKGATPRALYDLLLNRGTVNRDNVRVTNYSNHSILLHVYAADAGPASDGGFVVASRTAVPADVATWVHIGGLATGSTLRLKARTQIDLPLVISVPLSAQPGDHAGALVVGYDIVSHDKRGNAVDVEDRVAARIYARINGVARAGVRVSALRATYHQSWLPWGRGRLDARFTLQNTGNIRESMTSLLRMSGLLGVGAQQKALGGPGDVLPGGTVDMVVPTQQVRPALREQVTVQTQATELSLGPGGPPPVTTSGSAELTVHPVPWSALGCLVLLAVAITLFVRWRRRPRRTGRHGDTPPPPPTPTRIVLPDDDDRILVLPPDDHALVGPRVGQRRSARARVSRAREAMVVTVLAIAAPLGLGALGAAPASAAAHALYFAPGVGTSVTPAYVVTDSGCPTGSSNIVGRAYGHGFPSSGQPVVNNSTSGVSHSTPFVIPLQDTMSSFAKMNHTTLRGTYRITLTCTDRLQLHPSIVFAGAMRFDTRLHFTAEFPPPGIVRAVQAGESAPAGSTVPGALPGGPATTAPHASGTATSGAGAKQPASGSHAAAGGTTQLADQPAASTASSGTRQGLLIGGALLSAFAVLLIAVWLVRDHRRTTGAGR